MSNFFLLSFFIQPKEQIAKTLSESIKYVNNEQLRAAKKRRGTPRRSGIQEENMFQSSAIVYTVSEVTPFSDRLVLLL